MTEEIVDQAWDPRIICVDCFRVSCWEWSYWILWFQLEANCQKILRSKIHIVQMIFKWHFHTLKCEAYICWILKRLIFLWMDNNQPHITEICYNLNSFIRYKTIQIKVTFKAGLWRRNGNWACTVLKHFVSIIREKLHQISEGMQRSIFFAAFIPLIAPQTDGELLFLIPIRLNSYFWWNKSFWGHEKWFDS